MNADTNCILRPFKNTCYRAFLYGNFQKTDLLLTFIIKSVTIKVNLCTKVMNISGEFV